MLVICPPGAGGFIGLDPTGTATRIAGWHDRGTSMQVVTGAFGYIGRYVARELLARGEAVRTITTHVDKPNPFGAAVEAGRTIDAVGPETFGRGERERKAARLT
jgi:hypothetical protein